MSREPTTRLRQASTVQMGLYGLKGTSVTGILRSSPSKLNEWLKVRWWKSLMHNREKMETEHPLPWALERFCLPPSQQNNNFRHSALSNPRFVEMGPGRAFTV